MSRIIPYIKDFEVSKGAFITFSNEIVLVHGNHDKTAFEYCHSIPSKLTPKENELFQHWVNCNKSVHNERESDFLVYVLLYDKIENMKLRNIMTAHSNPYTRYYNYCLMDWNINPQQRMVYNPDTNTFERKILSNWFTGSIEEQEAKQEIEEIKKNVLLKDRHYFFKD